MPLVVIVPATRTVSDGLDRVSENCRYKTDQEAREAAGVLPGSAAGSVMGDGLG